MNLTSLSEFGEVHLNKHLTRNISIKNKSTRINMGDDATVANYGDHQTVLGNALFMEGVHFDLSYFPLKHLGYKAAVAALTSVYAMNARPRQLTISVAVSNRFTVEAMEELYKGINTACEMYGTDLTNSHITSSKSGMAIHTAAMGEAAKDRIAQRNGAQENDLIFVSGDLGAAYMGLQLLEREKKLFLENPQMQPELGNRSYILERQLKPEARKHVVDFLEEQKLQPTSMIAVTDGLASELLHICDASNVGCNIFEEELPIDAQMIDMAEEFHLEPTICVMNGGEDYELMFTLPLETYEKIKPLLRDNHLSMIGHITDAASGAQLIGKNGTSVTIEAQGWQSQL